MFFVMWFVVLIFIFVYLNSLYLEYDIEDVIEVLTFKWYLQKASLFLQ
jgi:hypothetical protein